MRTGRRSPTRGCAAPSRPDASGRATPATRRFRPHCEGHPLPVRGPDRVPDVAPRADPGEVRTIGPSNVHGSGCVVPEGPIRKHDRQFAAIWRPADCVVRENEGCGRSRRGQPRQAAAVRADDERVLRRAIASLALRARTEEHELRAVRRGNDRSVMAGARVGQLDQASTIRRAASVEAHPSGIAVNAPSFRGDHRVSEPSAAGKVERGIGDRKDLVVRSVYVVDGRRILGLPSLARNRESACRRATGWPRQTRNELGARPSPPASIRYRSPMSPPGRKRLNTTAWPSGDKPLAMLTGFATAELAIARPAVSAKARPNTRCRRRLRPGGHA